MPSKDTKIWSAIAGAVHESIARVRGRSAASDRLAELTAIAERCAALPEVDDRSADEILGYDENGLPT